MKKILLVFLCILSAAAWTVTDATGTTRLYNDRDIVTSRYGGFCVDGDGYLWIGTQYGLLRFDGTNFYRYIYDEESETSLSDNRINKILRDSDNRMWVATCEGLNLYDSYNDNFRQIPLPSLSHKGYISDICQLSSGDIVFMVAGVGLYVIDFSSGEPVAVKFMPQIEVSSTLNTLAESPKGDLLAGNHAGEIVKIAPNGQSEIFKVDDSYIKILLADNDGNIFVSTTTKAWLWDMADYSFREIQIPEGKHPVLDNATLTKKGEILVGTLGNGLYSFDRSSMQLKPYTDLNNPFVDLDRSRISTVYGDSLGNLWLGCSHQGVILAPNIPSLFNFISIAKSLPDYNGGTTRVAVTPANNDIWVGLDDGRLLLVDDYNVRPVHDFKAKIGSMIVSSRGTLYIGIENNGLYEFIPSDHSVRQLITHKGSYMVPALAEGPDGNIYIAVHGEGILKFNPVTKEVTAVKGKDGKLSCNWTSALLTDSRGRIWIGKYGGISVYDPATGEHTSISDLHPAMIKGVHNTITEDPDGNIWAATSNGLYIINPDDYSYRRLTKKEGLCDSNVSTIAFDSDGNAWVGTHDGVNRIDKDFKVTVFYGKNDIADSDYFSVASNLGGVKRLIFSGENGLTLINPEVLKTPPPEGDSFFISNIQLNGAKVTPVTLSSNGHKILNDKDKDHISISYRDYSLVLFLASKDFKPTDNTTYQWRVKDLADDWVSAPAGSGMIALPHLDPGNHTLEIRAMENGLITPAKTVRISVDSPWYLTTFAKLFYLVIFLLLIILLWRLVKHKNSEQINEEKIKFFINISHEIRSPLTLILGPLERIMKKSHDPETVKDLNAIHRNANRILALINQLLDIRKMEKGKMELDCSETEIISFTNDLVDIFRPQSEEKHITLNFSTSNPELKHLNVWIDRNNFDKVLVNLLTNAIKYTPEGGEIDIEVGKGYDSSMGDYAEITVTDTGIGLEEKNLPHLFDRFYQGKFNKGSMPLGFGIGLDLCRLLVELHNGTITAANRTDTKGSRFTVRIPLRPRNAVKKEIAVSPIPETTTEERKRILNQDTALPQIAAEQKKTRKMTSMKILVVDDDTEIRSYLADVLSNIGKVSEAVDGEDALRKVMELHPDLIISDVVMPEMDGLQLLKTLKTNVTTNHIPVILLSSKNDVADRMAGWDKGADGYLGKPFNINELQALIDNLIDNRLRLRGKFSGIQEQDSKIETPVLKGNDTVLIDKIVSEINDHLEDPNLNVEKLCQEVGLSRAHLNRKMKELFGLTPSEFIRNMRLRKACDLLRQGDVDISQIAYSVGFISQPHFSTAFKRFTGFSPSEYRANAPASDKGTTPPAAPSATTKNEK